MLNPVGATCTILFQGETEPVEGYYIHFGDCPDDDSADDDRIFFYADGEHEVKDMMISRGLEGFIVVSYELEYSHG